MSDIIQPTDFQTGVLSTPESYNLFLGGGRGGGKTYAILLIILRHANQCRDLASILVTRKRLKSLAQFAEELRRLLKAAFGPSVVYNGQDNLFRCPNGAIIQLAHCENTAALQDTVQGMTFSLIVVDEVGEAPQLPVVDAMALSLRQRDVPLRMVLAGNPGGKNHSAIAERYVTGREPWIPFEFAGRVWIYAPSTVDDNNHLPKEYRNNFEILRHTDPSLYKAHRFGNWSAIVGDYFAGAWDAERMVIDHHDVPPEYFHSLRLAIDWGSAAPCAIVLGGRTSQDIRLSDDRVIPSKSWIIYDEHLEHDPHNIARGSGKSPIQIAPAIHNLCLRNSTRIRGVIDSAAEARSAGHNQASIADLFRAANVQVMPARKGPRVPRFEAMKQHMVDGEFYVTSRCRNWLATVPTLPRDPAHPEDVDTKANDHMLDATSYLLAGETSRIKTSPFIPNRAIHQTNRDRIVWI